MTASPPYEAKSVLEALFRKVTINAEPLVKVRLLNDEFSVMFPEKDPLPRF